MIEKHLCDDHKITHLWSIMEHTSTWIRAADNKATAFLAIIGIFIGFLLTSLFEIIRDPNIQQPYSMIRTEALVLLIIGVASLCYSGFCAFLCLTSRTGISSFFRKLIEPKVDRSQITHIYFGNIANYSKSEYINKVEHVNSSQIIADLSDQIHVLSRIAKEKYRWLNHSYTSIAISLFSFLLIGLIILF